MRFMVLIKATKETEAGILPSERLLADMGAFNEELVNAGIMLGGEGLHPSSKAKRIQFDGQKTTVIDGPFAESKELIAGFWLWQLPSMEEAVKWARKIPNTDGVHGGVEIRQVFEIEDFGDKATPEIRAQEERLRQAVERR